MTKRMFVLFMLWVSVVMFLPARSNAAEGTLKASPAQTSGEKQYAYLHHGRYRPGYYRRVRRHRRIRHVRRHHRR